MKMNHWVFVEKPVATTDFCCLYCYLSELRWRYYRVLYIKNCLWRLVHV